MSVDLFIDSLLSNVYLSNADPDRTHCPLFNTQGGGNWSSKLFVSRCSVRQAAHLLRGYCVSEEVSRWSFLHSKSSGAVMRLLLAFVIVLCDVGFIGCKLSPKCPSGQFMWKNQCVLCHPTCSECNGHELFECTTCGVGEPFLPVLSA